MQWIDLSIIRVRIMAASSRIRTRNFVQLDTSRLMDRLGSRTVSPSRRILAYICMYNTYIHTYKHTAKLAYTVPSIWPNLLGIRAAFARFLIYEVWLLYNSAEMVLAGPLAGRRVAFRGHSVRRDGLLRNAPEKD